MHVESIWSCHKKSQGQYSLFKHPIGWHPKWYIPGPKDIGLLVLESVTLYAHCGQLGRVTIKTCFKFTALNFRSRLMKVKFNWPSGFWEYIDMSDLGWKVKGQLWNLLIATFSFFLKYQVRIMTLASTV